MEKQSQNPELWKTPEKAKNVLSKLENLKKEIRVWDDFLREVEEIKEMEEILTAEKALNSSDGSNLSYLELEQELQQRKQKLETEFQKQKLTAKMQGKYDRRNAILAIHAGAGGADAQDWAEMLMRMYLRFCEKQGWETRITDKSDGTEAGIKSAQIEINGNYAYGFLKQEKGVHRLVRLSPFNADHLRQTSFALVEIYQEIESEEIKISESELEFSSFRSSGPGGQSVNTTDSAVRIKHKPTGITVSCQTERSQMQNRESAIKILRSKLLELQEQKEKSERDQAKGKHISAGWSNQIRSYILHPYKMVKDHRTGVETSDIESVLDGDLKNFITL